MGLSRSPVSLMMAAMTATLRFLAVVLAEAYAQPAMAHTGSMAGGLVGGLAHPVFGPDHLVAMVAVGLWGAFLGPPAIYVLPIVFPLVMAFGGVLGILGMPLPGVEIGIATSAIVLGLMVVFAVRPPLWIAAVLVWLQPLVLATLSWPWVARAALLMAIVAPISLPLGLPFPLGLSKAGKGGLLPWAWGLNGAFSVVATPLANLIAREAGFSRVLFCAAILYAIARIAFPATRSSSKWQNSVQPSVAAE